MIIFEPTIPVNSELQQERKKVICRIGSRSEILSNLLVFRTTARLVVDILFSYIFMSEQKLSSLSLSVVSVKTCVCVCVCA